MKVRKPKTSDILDALGAPPWNEETLTKSYFKNHEATTEAMKHHPGTTLHWALDNVEKAQRLFNMDVNDLLELIGRLREFVAEPSVHLPDGREDLARLEWELQRRLYHFASAAQTLVDMGRVLREALSPEAESEYDRLRSSIFDSGEHEFVIALRNSFSHAKLPDANWNATRRWVEDGREVETRVLIKTTDLVDTKKME